MASSILGFEVPSGVVQKFRVWYWESALDLGICLNFVGLGTQVRYEGSCRRECRS